MQQKEQSPVYLCFSLSQEEAYLGEILDVEMHKAMTVNPAVRAAGRCL